MLHVSLILIYFCIPL